MNEFIGKKLGEILAFTEVAQETWEKGGSALRTVLGDLRVQQYIEVNQLHAQSIIEAATQGGVLEITQKKAQATGEKLRAMRDLYVADQWDNATELLEWSGFFEGAAIVHFALVKGAGEGSSTETLTLLAEEGMNLHYEMLDTVGAELQSVGQNRAQ